jgi:hypothetical protein
MKRLTLFEVSNTGKNMQVEDEMRGEIKSCK